MFRVYIVVMEDRDKHTVRDEDLEEERIRLMEAVHKMSKSWAGLEAGLEPGANDRWSSC